MAYVAKLFIPLQTKQERKFIKKAWYRHLGGEDVTIFWRDREVTGIVYRRVLGIFAKCMAVEVERYI